MSVFVIEIDQNLLNAAASEPNTVKLEVKMSDQEIEALLTSLKQETNNEDTNTELQWVLSYLDNPESVGEVKAIEEIQRVSDDMCVNGFPSKESAAVAPVMPPPAPVVAPRRPEMTIDRVVKTIHVRGSKKEQEEEEGDQEDTWDLDRQRMKKRGSLTTATHVAVASPVNSEDDSEQKQRELMKQWKLEKQRIEEERCRMEKEIEAAEKERIQNECSVLLKMPVVDDTQVWENVKKEAVLARDEPARVEAVVDPVEDPVAIIAGETPVDPQPEEPEVLELPSPEEEKKRRQREEEARKHQIEKGILSIKHGTPLFHRKVSYGVPLPTLPASLWNDLYAYSNAKSDTPLNDSHHITVLLSDQISQVAMSEILSWWIDLSGVTPSDSNPLHELQVKTVAMIQTVSSQPPTLLPPSPKDPNAKRVTFIAMEDVQDTPDLHERVQLFLAETRLGPLLSPEARATVDDNAKLIDVMQLVEKLSPIVQGNAGSNSNICSPLHLFARLPAFHTYTCSSSAQEKDTDILAEKPFKVPFLDVPVTESSIETTVCVLNQETISNTALVSTLLNKIALVGLDLVGLKLVYVDVIPTLVLAIRGHEAISRWNDVMGPRDPSLAKYTDPDSLRAQFESSVAQTPHTATKATEELMYWFGGRILPESMTNRTARYVPRPRPCFNVAPFPRSMSAFLVNPTVPTSKYGLLIEQLEQWGLTIAALKRVAGCALSHLGIAQDVTQHPYLIGVVVHENASVHLDAILPHLSTIAQVVRVPTTGILNGDFLREVLVVPPSNLIRHQMEKLVELQPFDAEKEKTSVAVFFVDVSGSTGAASFGLALKNLLAQHDGEIQVMGLKFIQNPQLELIEELRSAKTTQKSIGLDPIFICVLRSLSVPKSSSKSMLIVSKYLKAYRIVIHSFLDHEICYDDTISTCQRLYFPPAAPTISEMLFETESSTPLASCVIVKPEKMAKKLISLLKRASRDGFTILSVTFQQLNEEVIEKLLRRRSSHEELSYLTCGVSAIVWLHRVNGIHRLQSLLGPDSPDEAKESAEFSLRAVFGTDLIHNGFYGTRSYASVLIEAHLFGKGRTFEQLCQGAIVPSEIVQSRMFIRARLTLNQTICVRISPSCYEDGSYIDIMERFLQESYILVNIAIVSLTPTQVKEFKGETIAGNWVVLALQKDNAISRAKTLIGEASEKPRSILSIFRNRGLSQPALAEIHGPHIYASETMQEAQRELLYFFDTLYDSVDAIKQN